jgi:hypothetical protein
VIILAIVVFLYSCYVHQYGQQQSSTNTAGSKLYQSRYRHEQPRKSPLSSPSYKFNAAEYDHNISLIDQRLKSLRQHSFLRANTTSSLLQYMKHTSRQPQCTNKPLFIAIAQVQSDLYWQLIENFMYSMVQFDHIECSVMICVSDPLCVRMCADKHFPCFDYNYHQLHTNSTSSTEAEAGTTVHVMEQIATIKLFEVSNALEAGIHVLLLDLDVGFLRDPMILFEGFLDNPYEHVRYDRCLCARENYATLKCDVTVCV